MRPGGAALVHVFDCAGRGEGWHGAARLRKQVRSAYWSKRIKTHDINSLDWSDPSKDVQLAPGLCGGAGFAVPYPLSLHMASGFSLRF
jgi:hypothetical protein